MAEGKMENEVKLNIYASDAQIGMTKSGGAAIVVKPNSEVTGNPYVTQILFFDNEIRVDLSNGIQKHVNLS